MMPSLPARHYFVSGNPLEPRKPVRTISELLFAIRHFVSVVTNSRQHTSLKRPLHASARLHARAQNCGLPRQFI
jgi:hypothetical protein